MTEAEWLGCDDPLPMLEHLAPWASHRKLRLFACQCCRDPEPWRSLVAHGGDRLVVTAEAYLDGEKEWHEVAALRQAAPMGWTKGGGGSMGRKPVHLGMWTQSLRAAAHVGDNDAWDAAWGVVREGANFVGPRTAALLRDIVGNPFRPSTRDLVWINSGALSLAQIAYEERALPSGHLDPARLAVLSDALEEAGCTDADVLSHLRSPGPHVRGCRALDLVLGR